LEAGAELVPPLCALGAPAAFHDADFSGISDDPLFIGGAVQRTFLDVNEKGTEAAAISSESLTMSAHKPPPLAFEMFVDRPCLCFIRHQPTDTILFMGLIYDPQPTVAAQPAAPEATGAQPPGWRRPGMGNMGGPGGF
jgi:serpin B